MTSRYDEIIENFAKGKKLPKGKGHFLLGLCNTCGTVALKELDKEKPRGFDVTPLGTECPNCKEVHQRNPEVFLWTLNVMSKLHSDILASSVTPKDN